MSTTLVDGLTDVFQSQALAPFAARSGESESSILKGFQTSIEAMIAGLSSKIGQGGTGRQLLDLINSPGNDARILENAGGLVDHQPVDGPGLNLTSMLFGGRFSSISDKIGRESGIRAGTAASLMTLGAPLLLSLLGQRARQFGMDSSRLTTYLSEEAESARGMLPQGVSNLLGSDTAVAVPPVTSAVVEEKSRGWLWPLIAAAVIILGLIWWFARPSATLQTTENTAASAINYITRTLPGNLALHIPVGRMEDHLLAFIGDPSRPVDETTWFDFDRLLFNTDSATLQPGSTEQLSNIAAILRSYPNIHVKIGGYTDNTGDQSANMTLSQQRADSVKQQLISMGIAPERLEAQGYGDQNPVGDNSTPQGRQMNRRISLRVTQK